MRSWGVHIPYARGVAIALVLGSVAIAGQAAYSSSSGGGGYVVQSGDTLWAISQRSGVSVQALAAANGMRLTEILPIGRHLTIPGQGSSSVASSSAGTVPAASGSFCATFTPTAGPRGVLPSLLSASPSRLALRPYFVEWGEHYGVSPALLEAIAWQESGWQQGVVSSASAVGVGQLLPSTASFVSTQLIGTALDITAVSDNIRLMAAYVAYLAAHTSSTCETIAGYYEGLANLRAYGVFTVSQPYVASVDALLPRFE